MNNALSMGAYATSARRPKQDKENRGETNCITIMFTENGFAVCASFDPKHLDPKKDSYSQMPDDEKFTFGEGTAPSKKSVDDALAYVKGLMYEHVDEEEAEDKDKGKLAKKVAAKAADDEDE